MLKSINEIALQKIVESTDPKPFESVILGTLAVVENPYALYDFAKTRISPKMFSEDVRPVAQLFFDMLDNGTSLRHYLILQEAQQRDLILTREDILNLRRQHAESDFEELCTTFVEKWYNFSLNESALMYAEEIQSGVNPLSAYKELESRNEEIINLRAGAKEQDYSLYGAAAKYVEIVEKRKADPNFSTGLQSGIFNFDKMTGGLEQGDLIAACGYAGQGKTTIVYQIVSHIARDRKVDIFSLEESPMNLSAKSLSAQTGVSTIDMKVGLVTDENIEDLKNSLVEISKLQISIIDDIFHIDELERLITLRVKKFGVSCVVLDNLTIIQHGYKGSRDDNETKITYRLKALAKRLKIPIIILVHQNKDSAGRADRQPTTTDIKFAGGGVAFDIVFFPYTTKEENHPFELNINTNIVITKNRGGGLVGAIPMIFVRNWGIYCEADIHGNPILPKQPKKETTEANKPSNIITQRGDVKGDIPF